MAGIAIRTLLLGALLAGIGLVALTAGVADRSGPTAPADAWPWQSIAWRFPRDAWPAGRSYRCPAARCGVQLDVHIRPKVGFCNCTTGVTDDEEVDRVSDLDLISAQFTPQGAGVAVGIAHLKGRARDYRLQRADGTVSHARGVALSRGCDLIVTVVEGSIGANEPALSDVLATAVTGWVRDSLDGRSR